MKAKLIDGKAIAATMRRSLRTGAAAFAKRAGRPPALAVMLAGEDPASQIYVRNKIAACAETGIKSLEYFLPKNVSERELADLIDALNEDGTVDGILVQLPLPKGLDSHRVLGRIKPEKDVDGFSAVNAGNLFLGNETLTACTASGCIELIRSTGVSIEGKHAVVVGRSNIVGKPVAMLLLGNNATVTVCHSKTRGLAKFTRQADILVCAVGKREFVTGDMIKPGAVVIDVGMNRVDGKLYGDVEFSSACEAAGFITPVPGGVGPMTITMLLYNCLQAARRNNI
ncbi:MAG: bifunctional methylenetetrahydrofolate dehydrogenase/methenyltetrahydrofolate cyclohydrolase FolD [Firmicutes bacterium]|nr:bifunctional methylenetetrahydrofolate dehydrogenase/methenyltetrahydrofolate cyclohydrolase FolD [Bacillota bacterium]